MIWNCKYVTNFWIEFRHYIQVKLRRTVTKQDIYYGTNDNLLCMLTIIAKQFVYTSNRQEKSPVFRIFVNKIMYTQKLEEAMYRNNNRIDVWFERWKSFI